MFHNLLKRIFDNTPEQDNPKPPVKLNISEPVYKMVEVVKRNPTRIKFKHKGTKDNSSGSVYCVISTYSIIDIETNEEFIINSQMLSCRGEAETYYDIEHNIEFTYDERNYLISEIKPIIENRINRLEKIKHIQLQKHKIVFDLQQKQLRSDLYKKLSETS